VSPHMLRRCCAGAAQVSCAVRGCSCCSCDSFFRRGHAGKDGIECASRAGGRAEPSGAGPSPINTPPDKRPHAERTICRGGLTLVVASTLAPTSSSSLTTARCPHQAARCRDVQPSCNASSYQQGTSHQGNVYQHPDCSQSVPDAPLLGRSTPFQMPHSALVAHMLRSGCRRAVGRYSCPEGSGCAVQGATVPVVEVQCSAAQQTSSKPVGTSNGSCERELKPLLGCGALFERMYM
jgi:hypothetical protein